MNNEQPITCEQVPGIPKGYKLLRIGTALKGEKYLHCSGRVVTCEHSSASRKNYIILCEISKPRRQARLPQDLGKPAWFRDIGDDDDDNWSKGILCGQMPESDYPSSKNFIDDTLTPYDECEVECDNSEPEWITPTEEHLGLECEVRDYPEADWLFPRLLHDIDPYTAYRFKEKDGTSWRYARIRNPNYKG